MKVWEAEHEVATRTADGSCSLEAIVWTVEVALLSTSGTLPTHFAVAAELEKPSGKAGTTAFEVTRVVSILSWSRKRRRQCIQTVKSRELVRKPRNWKFYREWGGKDSREILFCVFYYYSLGNVELHIKESELTLCVHQDSSRKQAITLKPSCRKPA